MENPGRNSLTPGDMIAVRTGAGMRFAQVIHNHVTYPDVVRVIEGVFGDQETDLENISARPTAYCAFVQLGNALLREDSPVRLAGRAAVPANHSSFPEFVTPIRNRQGEIAYWWLWDGDRLRYVTDPPDEAQILQGREVMSLDAFLHRLEERL